MMSTTESTTAAPERSRETRIGLVMYGGVSLAVYIHGVSQEFYHAVQGNGVYRLIKELTDSEIILDILSGSSAGGVNGILLAYALCNEKDFTCCDALWRGAADIHRLVRTPSTSSEPVRSLLDSEGYYQTELERAFRLLDSVPATGESPSPLKELDLFITGTDIDGRIEKRVDDAGHLIEVKDYRSVFHLKHRRGRKSNLDANSNPAVITALSKLARITSCFPGAFAPVFVSHANISGKSPSRMSANELLQYWGNLPTATYLIDGGVIDNKPFTHTTREIFFRTTERKVDRKLYYVEPDIEHFPDRDVNSIPNAPSFLKPILNSLVTIPGYESITDDLRLLAERNESIREYRRVLQNVAESYEFSGTPKPGVEVPADIPEPQRSIYSRTRYASISSRVLDGVFKEATLQNSRRVSAYRTALIEEFDRRTENTTGVLRDFDILFRLRRIFNLIYFVYARMYVTTSAENGAPRRERYLPVLKRLNHQLELYDVLHAAIERMIHKTDYGWDETKEPNPGEIWDRVVTSLQLLLRSEGLVAHLDNLQELNQVLQRRIDRLSEGLSFPIGNFSSVLVHADMVETAFLEDLVPSDDPVFRRYLHFNEIDSYLFPLEWVSGLREKDVINVCRISPSDAQRGFSQREARTKTAGDTLAHFSAFFKRTWRSNDIMWGRLDGVCELVETLLTGPAIEAAMNDEGARERARAALLPTDGSPSPLNEWFKDSSEAAVASIKSWVESVTDPDPWKRTQALTSFYTDSNPQVESIRTLLIEMAQFRIMHESLPLVFEDSIKEQAEWKQIRKQKGSDASQLQWHGTDVGMDSTALSAVAAIGGKKLVEELGGGRPLELSPKESRLGRIFAGLEIGSEEVWGGGVPLLVLSEIGLKALLVLRSCVIGSFSERTGGKIRASTFFRWGVDLPLRSLYGGITFFRTAPPLQPAILAGGTIFSLLALFVGLRWRDPIIESGGDFSILSFCVFIVAPLAWLTASIYQLTRSRGSEGLGRNLRNAFTAICTAAPLISVTLLYFGLTDLFHAWWNGTLEPTRSLRFLTIFLYGIVPFLLSFLGGYLAVQSRNRAPEVEDLADALARMTESDLQDVCDRVGEPHQVTPKNRADIVKGLTVAAEMNNGVGTLTRAIRAVSPGVLD
jgi:predicted acylesterase/phospholipase RssA